MASITLKDIPASLHRALKSRAKANKRSLNQEAISVLSEAVNPSASQRMEALLAESKRFRESLNFIALPDEIDRFKRQGRK